MRVSTVLILLALVTSCGTPATKDLQAPALVRNHLASASVYEVEWNEPVVRASARADFPPHELPATIDANKVSLPVPATLEPGRNYGWSLSVSDAAGNDTSVQGQLRGPNSDPASLVFNEVRFAGSKGRGDAVEFLVTQAGHLGGWTLTLTQGAHEAPSLVFPDRKVVAGEVLVVRFQADFAVKCPVWDFPGGKGLSATLGLLCLKPNAQALPTQVFLWAKRPGEALALARKQGLEVSDSEEHTTAGCTATRTWSRRPEGNWVITATGGASLGAPNDVTSSLAEPSSRKSVRKTTTKTPRRHRHLRPSKRFGRGATPSRVE